MTGRGALDAKGVAIVHLFTLTELARRGVKLSRDVILLATPDEEMGGVAGAGWVAHERRDLLRGAAYLLTEGGGIVANDERGSAWGIAVTEKTPCWLRVTARGVPGHGSVPGRNAAVPRLIAGLDRIRQLETPVRVVPEVAAMFRRDGAPRTARRRPRLRESRRGARLRRRLPRALPRAARQRGAGARHAGDHRARRAARRPT